MESCVQVSVRDWEPAEDKDIRCLSQVSFPLPPARFLCSSHSPSGPKSQYPTTSPQHHSHP